MFLTERDEGGCDLHCRPVGMVGAGHAPT
jgi:hypothetical protein